MNNNKLKNLLGMAALALPLLLAPACTDDNDTLPGGADGTTIALRVAPKAGFTDGTAATRTTVGSDGSLTWQTGDRIYMKLTFNDKAATSQVYTLVRTASDWSMFTGLLATGANTGTPATLKWPLGANKVSVKAFHTDCSTTVSGSDITLNYAGSTGDVMEYSAADISIGESITLNLTHKVVRLKFSFSLEASTAYQLKDVTTSVSTLNTSSWTPTTAQQSFTSGVDGALVICAPLSGTNVAAVLQKADGTEVYSATIANAAPGSTYTWLPDTEGNLNPGDTPGLLVEPIIVGNKVYEVNGYYVTAPAADEKKTYSWAAIESATVMDSDPCAKHGNWRMPTMKDFEAMAGWTVDNPWSQTATTTSTPLLSDQSAWYAAFPYGKNFWSSVEHAVDPADAWFVTSGGNTGMANYNRNAKTFPLFVRCVQRIATPSPVRAGNTVYEVNGYYVTAPGATEDQTYQWASTESATKMENDPCAGHGNWRMPDMYDFMEMAGWAVEYPWSEDDLTTDRPVLSDKAAWIAAFPYVNGIGHYWSSVPYTKNDITYAWAMYTYSNGKVTYGGGGKKGKNFVRCVQRIARPAPITADNKIYEVNGYYVTAPVADEMKTYPWAASESATKMDSDPCAKHDGWHMPTTKDFEAMAGWTGTDKSWSQNTTNITVDILSGQSVWNAAFPEGSYWSSVARTLDSDAWTMYSTGNGRANYHWSHKKNEIRVRCVCLK